MGFMITATEYIYIDSAIKITMVKQLPYLAIISLLIPPVLGGDHLFPIIMHNHRSDRGSRRQRVHGARKVPKSDNQSSTEMAVQSYLHLREGGQIMAGQNQWACYRYRAENVAEGMQGLKEGVLNQLVGGDEITQVKRSSLGCGVEPPRPTTRGGIDLEPRVERDSSLWVRSPGALV